MVSRMADSASSALPLQHALDVLQQSDQRGLPFLLRISRSHSSRIPSI